MQKPGTPTTSIVKGSAGAVTATQTSGKINAGGYGASVKAFLNISAVSGTSPTLLIAFQDSPDNANWYPITGGAFSSQTATGQNTLTLTNVGPYLRAVQTLGGATPSFTFDLSVSGTN